MSWNCILQDYDGDYVSDIVNGGSETIRYTFLFTKDRTKAKVFSSDELWNRHDNLGLAVAFACGYTGNVIPVE